MPKKLVTSFAFAFAFAGVVAITARATDDSGYAAHGTVKSIDASMGTVTIDHEDIPGLMKGMTMTFFVSAPELLRGVSPGQVVDFRVLQEGDRYTVTELRPAANGEGAGGAAAAGRAAPDIAMMGAHAGKPMGGMPMMGAQAGQPMGGMPMGGMRGMTCACPSAFHGAGGIALLALGTLIAGSAAAALIALTVFLVRRSRRLPSG